MDLIPSLGPLFISTGEGLAGEWWTCLPTTQVPLGKGATLLWEVQKTGLTFCLGQSLLHLSAEEVHEGQRRMCHLWWSPLLSV